MTDTRRQPGRGRRKTGEGAAPGIGAALRALRTARGLNQRELADRLGVTKGSVSNWEMGLSRPDYGVIRELCVALDTSADVLFGVPGSHHVPEEDRRVLDSYRRLLPRDRRTILSLMDLMAENREADLRSSCAQRFRRLPVEEDKVCAGSGNPLENGGQGQYLYLDGGTDARRADVVITVTGSSMEPTYRDGDRLLVEYTQTLLPGEIGIFVLAGAGTVKEYRPDGLYPHNRSYSVIHPTEDDDLRCVGRVLGTVTDNMLPTREEERVLDELFASRG